MLAAFVVLVRTYGSPNLALQSTAAPDGMLAMAAVSQSLRDSGRDRDVVVGVFRREDWAAMGQLFEQVESVLQR